MYTTDIVKATIYFKFLLVGHNVRPFVLKPYPHNALYPRTRHTWDFQALCLALKIVARQIAYLWHVVGEDIPQDALKTCDLEEPLRSSER